MKTEFTQREIDLAKEVSRKTKESIKLAGRILEEISFYGVVMVRRFDWDLHAWKSHVVNSVTLKCGELQFICRDGETYPNSGRLEVVCYRCLVRGVRKRASNIVLKKCEAGKEVPNEELFEETGFGSREI